jgi:hypothetical protein
MLHVPTFSSFLPYSILYENYNHAVPKHVTVFCGIINKAVISSSLPNVIIYQNILVFREAPVEKYDFCEFLYNVHQHENSKWNI